MKKRVQLTLFVDPQNAVALERVIGNLNHLQGARCVYSSGRRPGFPRERAPAASHRRQ
ncbi:MAG: hypothetical protein JNL02_18550 [Saprospiraceae bacterium]|nr:hypothetical protein [Saprospiraceae bacterium]